MTTVGPVGELPQAEKSLNTEQKTGAPDTPNQNGDLHSDRAYSVARSGLQGSHSDVTR